METQEALTLAVRTGSKPLSFSVPIQKPNAELDPGLPVSDVFTLQEIIARSLGNASLSGGLVLGFAGLSLTLASVGLYGVLSYLTMQRTSEIGVRMAMGARREQGVRLMLSDGLRPALYGLTLDLAASIGAVRLIQAMLYGTRPPGQGIELFGLRASNSLRERSWVHTAIAQYWSQSLRNIFSNALG